jgi:hypothetical protein
VSSSSLLAAALLSKNTADGRRKSVSDSSGKQILAGKFGSVSKKTALAEMSEMELEGMSVLIGASRCPHLTPHTQHLTPHTSHLTPHTSHLTPHTSHLTPHTSHLTPDSVQCERPGYKEVVQDGIGLTYKRLQVAFGPGFVL